MPTLHCINTSNHFMDSVISYDEVLKRIAFPHNIRIGQKDKTGNLTEFHDIAQQKRIHGTSVMQFI